MMSPGKRNVFKTVAILLALSLSQLYVQIGLAAPAIPVEPQRLIAARLTTTGNRPILVNGTNVSTGGTILTGARLETGDQVGATIDLGALGTLQLGPNTIVVLNYTDDGEVNVLLVQGCMVLTANRGTHGKVDTKDGNAGDSDKAAGGVYNFCYLNGALSSGTATNVGAVAGTAAAAGGSSNALWWAIGLTIAGTVGGLAWGLRGGNSSPSAP